MSRYVPDATAATPPSPTGRAYEAQLAAVYRVALAAAVDRREQVRVVAGGTLAAADWTFGTVDRPPVTRRRLSGPGREDVELEYLAALEARAGADDRMAFANDTGVVDWLALVLRLPPEAQDPPWWGPLLDAPAS